MRILRGGLLGLILGLGWTLPAFAQGSDPEAAVFTPLFEVLVRIIEANRVGLATLILSLGAVGGGMAWSGSGGSPSGRARALGISTAAVIGAGIILMAPTLVRNLQTLLSGAVR